MTLLRPCVDVRWIHAAAADDGACAADPDGRIPGGRARLLLAEMIAAAWLAGTTLLPARRPRGSCAAGAALVIGPAWLPARSLATLGRRLERAGLAVATARLPFETSRARLARVAARGERLLRRSDATRLDLVLYAAAARRAAALATLWSPAILGRIVLLGGPPAPAAPAADAVLIHPRDDPWSGARPAPRAGARIEVRGVGRLALLLAPSVADLVAEACLHVPAESDA